MTDQATKTLDRATSDAFADIESHIFSLGMTVIELMADGMKTDAAITEMAKRSGETFEFVRSATIDTLQREIGRRSAP